MLARVTVTLALIAGLILSGWTLTGCELSGDGGDPRLVQNVRCQLVDWHISGFMVINSPVAWVRVVNYNPFPIKDMVLQYNTYDTQGRHLDQGTYIIEGTVPPGTVKNFPELYLGLVSVHSEKLRVKLLSAKPA